MCQHQPLSDFNQTTFTTLYAHCNNHINATLVCDTFSSHDMCMLISYRVLNVIYTTCVTSNNTKHQHVYHRHPLSHVTVTYVNQTSWNNSTQQCHIWIKQHVSNVHYITHTTCTAHIIYHMQTTKQHHILTKYDVPYASHNTCTHVSHITINKFKQIIYRCV